MKNRCKYGGRAKGTSNKITASVKDVIHEFLKCNINNLQGDFDKLQPIQRLYFIEKMLKYVISTKPIEPHNINVRGTIFQFEEDEEETATQVGASKIVIEK